MPLDFSQVLRIVVLVVVGGLLLLAITFLVEFLMPLLIAAGLILLAYIIYKFFTTGRIGL